MSYKPLLKVDLFTLLLTTTTTTTKRSYAHGGPAQDRDQPTKPEAEHQSRETNKALKIKCIKPNSTL